MRKSTRLALAVLCLAPLLMAASQVNISAQGSLKSAAVSVGTTAVLMTTNGSSTDRKSITLFNNSAATTIYCGSSAVTSAAGYPVLAQSPFSAAFGSGPAVYCVTASGTADVRVLEVW